MAMFNCRFRNHKIPFRKTKIKWKMNRSMKEAEKASNLLRLMKNKSINYYLKLNHVTPNHNNLQMRMKINRARIATNKKERKVPHKLIK